MIKKQNLKGTVILMITALLWGLGFIAQSAGRENIGTNTFNSIRMFLAVLVLLPISLVIEKKERKIMAKPKDKKPLFKAGVICGTVLCIASSIQTEALAYTTAGKSGFITALYIVFVPIIGLLIGKKISLKTIICAIIALFGMYLLTMTSPSEGINKGDVMTFICAICFSVHIIVIDKYAQDINVIQFSCVQFFVCGVINMILMFIFEKPEINAIWQSAVPILYAGLCSCGIAYTIQPLGQKYAEPSTAAIVMSLESVFAMIFGAIFPPHTIPTFIEIIGCVIMFVAIILCQLPFGEKKEVAENGQ